MAWCGLAYNPNNFVHMINFSNRTKRLALVALLLVVLPLLAASLLARGVFGSLEMERSVLISVLLGFVVFVGFGFATAALVSLCLDAAAGHKL